jgi:hypothetical protein
MNQAKQIELLRRYKVTFQRQILGDYEEYASEYRANIYLLLSLAEKDIPVDYWSVEEFKTIKDKKIRDKAVAEYEALRKLRERESELYHALEELFGE